MGLRKIILGWVVPVLIGTSVLMFGYYVVFIREGNTEGVVLGKLEDHISTHYYTLMQNRISFVELTELEVGLSQFSLELERLLLVLNETNEKGLSSTASSGDINSLLEQLANVTGVGDKEIESNRLLALIEKTNLFYQTQAQYLSDLAELTNVLGKLFQYDPGHDFDPELEKEILVQRVESAHAGLSQIEKDLRQLGIESASYSNLILALTETKSELTSYSDRLVLVEGSGFSDDRIGMSFAKLKGEGLDLLLEIITSDHSLEMLTGETNLILEYEHWLELVRSV